MATLPGFWTAARKAEAQEVAGRRGNHWREIAAELSARWGHPLSDEAVRGALLPRRNGGTRLAPPNGYMGTEGARPPVAAPEAPRPNHREGLRTEPMPTEEHGIPVVWAPPKANPGHAEMGGLRAIRGVSLFDLHAPEHDRAFWSVVLQVVSEIQPDEIDLAGDVGEFLSATRHGGNWGAMLSDDFAAVKRLLNDLRDAAPNATTRFYEGNHETRLARRIDEMLPQLGGAVTIPGGLDLEERGIAYIPERQQPYWRGKLATLHGHQMMGKWGSKYHSAKAADLYGAQAGTICQYGHTHRPQSFSRAVAGGTVRAYGIGCGRTLGPEVAWLHGAEQGWAHQFSVWTVLPDGEAHLTPVDVVRGRAVYGGKVYSGR